jgi:hypothetical protein
MLKKPFTFITLRRTLRRVRRQYLSTGATQGPIFEDDVPGDYQIVSAGFYARWKRLRVRLQSATGTNIQISFFRIGRSLE